jgi:hypothetical protein
VGPISMRHQAMWGSEYGPVGGLVGRFWPRRAADMRYVECVDFGEEPFHALR